jgi:hypothetical protein
LTKIFGILLIAILLTLTVLATAVDNPQGNNPVCGPCSSYGLGFNGPLEYTPYPEPLNVGAQNPGKIYVVYSVIDKKSRLWWTEQTGVWQAWGPYEFKAGKGYILEFGPQDSIGMTEGPHPYYVEGTAAWLQEENVDYMTENAYAFCIVPEAGGFAGDKKNNLPTDVPDWIEVKESMLTASSTYDGYTPITSFDTDLSENSGWCAKGGQKKGWIVVDFGTVKDLTRVKVVPDRHIATDPSDSYLDRFRIDAWIDNSWHPMSSLISTPDETWYEVPLKVSTDKIRIWAESDGNGPQIKGIKIQEEANSR